MSLQTGGQLARVKAPLIDPRNLTIIAFELDGPRLDQHPSFLTTVDIREMSSLGFIVDSSDEFVGLDDVIRLKEVHDFAFELIDTRVEDESGHHLGKVISYSVEPGSFYIKQLNVKRPLLKSLSDTELLIDRSQIVSVSDDAIIIKNDERQPAPAKQATKTFTNPFRGTTPAPEAINSEKR